MHPIHAVSGPLSPFDYQYPQSFALNPAPPALTEVTFSFTALADLASSAELVTLAINGSVIGDAFVSGVDCAEIQDSLIVSPAIYNSAIGDSGIGVISLTATAEVGSCTGSFIAVTVDYVGGAGPDCNFNGVPDECDLSTGTSQDCNDNNIPDECETDCNDNGIPDDCDLSQQTSPDCDGNGVPDECEGARQISETSPPLSPIDDQHPQSFTLDPAPPALEGVSLSFTALADLSSSSEYMFVELNGTEIGTIYSGYGDDCMVLEDSLIISALAYNSAVESTGMAVITVTPSSSVDPGTCADSFITIAIDYVGGTGNDCNVNGVPDECDLDSGFSEDCNLNGAPDECEIGGPIDAYQFLADLTAAADSISALVLDRYNFSGGESGTYISDGGGDMYDYGNELNTDLAFLIPYTGSTVVDSDLQFGPGSRYFTAKSTGLFVMAAIDISIGSFSITGNLGSGFEFADGFQISTTVNFRPYTIFVKRVYRTGCCNPSVNHVIIVPGDSDGLTQSFSANTNLDDHSIDGLADRDAIFFLLVARRDPSTSIGPPLEQPDALAMANAFLSLLPAGNDCNQNEIPDDCDILQATSEDCNENGVPDECERDCNGNGTPDACDLAAGTAEDCNADGIPDECNLTSGEFRVDSGQLSPLGDGFAQTLFIEQPPPAASTVRLAFQAVGDLSSSSAYVTVDLNGTVIGDVFVSTGSNCPPQPDVDQIYITPEVYNGTFAPGAPLEVMMTPSDAVDVFCDDPTFVQVTVDYQATSLDVDGNGILDACEACPADLDGDETVGVSDFLLVLAQWGPCPPVCIADVDGNGAVDVADFLAVLAHWGACP